MEYARQCGHGPSAAGPREHMARLQHELEMWRQATDSYDNVLERRRAAGDSLGETSVRHHLARLALEAGCRTDLAAQLEDPTAADLTRRSPELAAEILLTRCSALDVGGTPDAAMGLLPARSDDVTARALVVCLIILAERRLAIGAAV